DLSQGRVDERIGVELPDAAAYRTFANGRDDAHWAPVQRTRLSCDGTRQPGRARPASDDQGARACGRDASMLAVLARAHPKGALPGARRHAGDGDAVRGLCAGAMLRVAGAQGVRDGVPGEAQTGLREAEEIRTAAVGSDPLDPYLAEG